MVALINVSCMHNVHAIYYAYYVDALISELIVCLSFVHC
jgi:hypothetical protein